ncbi:hypothetical protein B0H13DRAFT_1877793 [Mycena leptocephala]|nr:hypothetical protein B0H13DRAFT_1877793 [Mycena leptocephala]
MSITLCALALDHARDHPSSINLDQSDSRLSGAAYDIYLGPLLTVISTFSIEFNRSAPRLPHAVHNMYIERLTPALAPRHAASLGSPFPAKVPAPKSGFGFFHFFFHLAVLTPLSPRYGGFPANPRPQRRGGGEERTIAAPKSGGLSAAHSRSQTRGALGSIWDQDRKKKVFFSSLATLVGIAGPVARPAHPNVGRSIPGARAHYRRFFFLATGRSSGLGKPPPTLANPPLVASDVGGPAVHEAGVHKKTGAGDFTSAVLPQTDDIENADFSRTCQFDLCRSTHPPPPPCCPPPFLDLLPPSWSALQAFLIPLGLPQRSDHSHDPERAMNNNAAYGYGLERFLDVRSVRPYAKEGPGSCYNIACVDDADIALYRAGGITGADLLARMTWKIGHSNDHERRRREYGGAMWGRHISGCAAGRSTGATTANVWRNSSSSAMAASTAGAPPGAPAGAPEGAPWGIAERCRDIPFGGVKSQAFYDRFEVPLLYDKWDGTIDVNTLSPGNVVLEIYVSFIRGRQGAMGLFEGNFKLLQVKCHERIHKITRTTPVFSDHMAVFCGHTTCEGDETTVIDTASDDEELDDIFGQARSAVERTAPQVTSPPQDNHKDDLQAGHPRLPHPRIHATSLQAHRNCHPAPSLMVSSTIKPTAHHLPDAGYSSPWLSFKAPTCTTRKCKLAILIPTGCSSEPLS